MTTSPLSEVSPDNLSLLYLTDPLTLTDAQFLALIVENRKRRNAFLAEEAATAAKGKKAKPVKEKSTLETAAVMAKPASEITAADLFGPDE